jgi:hypothetical protein
LKLGLKYQDIHIGMKSTILDIHMSYSMIWEEIGLFIWAQQYRFVFEEFGLKKVEFDINDNTLDFIVDTER